MPLRIESQGLLICGMVLTMIALVIALIRRTDLPRASLVLFIMGMICWSLAAARASWRRGDRQRVTVMVDVSASTRGAGYRQRTALEGRIRELIGDTPYRILLFADTTTADSGADVLSNMPSERTVYGPPSDAIVLLFSDGRFELPATGAPTYAVIDANLEQPVDAAVHRLEVRGDLLVADVSHRGPARVLALRPTTTRPVRVEADSLSVAQRLNAGAVQGTAQFDAGDLWPENDALTINTLPAAASEKWWVGAAAPGGWRGMEAGALPQSAEEYLAPAVIVLNNVPADSMPASTQQRLEQYVRDLGGGLIILGGDRAFAAGGYVGTPLDALSPLDSSPSAATRRWVVLVDGSGSMAAVSGGGSQWDVAGRAVGDLLRRLPPWDVIAVGSFAEQVSWWSNGKTVGQTAALHLPPGNLSPHGPTNLQRALVDATQSMDGMMPTELIIITDAEAQITNGDELTRQMRARRVTLHVMAIGHGAALAVLGRMAAETGGSVESALDPVAWADQLKKLGQAAMGRGIETKSLAVKFDSPLSLPVRDVSPWNRTWIKNAAEPLAEGRDGQEVIRPVARWQVGTGQVLAMAFAPQPAELEAMVKLIARPPHDPRFAVAWDAGPQLTVTVEALEGKIYLNNQALTLELRQGDRTTAAPIPQEAPGRYVVTVDAPRAPVFAAVKHNGRMIDQRAIAGRYAPEFDAIGNDHAALRELARRTGGAVIDTRQTKPIDIRWPPRDVPLMSWLAAAGALCIAAGLAVWRLA